MKELSKKVFRTIFIILSSFIVIGVVIYNYNLYKKEYDSVKNNLSIMEDIHNNSNYNNNYNSNINDNIIINNLEENAIVLDNGNLDNVEIEFSVNNAPVDNMMVMDYEVYSVRLNDNKIDRIINHSNSQSNFDVQGIADLIIKQGKGLKIGNLYTNKYSYNYSGSVIVIINTKPVNERLLISLIESMIVLIGFEIVIYLVSKVLTKRITKPAKESFDKQKDFIADASHELKTPLAVIMASSDELIKDERNEKLVDNIKHEAERMSSLIKSLLDLSKLENGISIDSYKEENISKIIERTCLTFEGIAFEQGVKIETNIDENIIFKCNKDEIEKLISILLDNAIKHSYKNSSIFVNVNMDKNINIEVINSGDPVKDEEKVFERFYREDKSRNRDSNRYGLGLAIAKNIVINHNGTIKAHSKEGKTTFKIILKK